MCVCVYLYLSLSIYIYTHIYKQTNVRKKQQHNKQVNNKAQFMICHNVRTLMGHKLLKQ